MKTQPLSPYIIRAQVIPFMRTGIKMNNTLSSHHYAINPILPLTYSQMQNLLFSDCVSVLS